VLSLGHQILSLISIVCCLICNPSIVLSIVSQLIFCYFFLWFSVILSELSIFIKDPNRSGNAKACDIAVSAIGRICEFHRDCIDGSMVTFLFYCLLVYGSSIINIDFTMGLNRGCSNSAPLYCGLNVEKCGQCGQNCGCIIDT